MILNEAPHRLVRTLGELKESLGNRRATLCRELTKRYETAFVSTLEELLAYYEKEEPKGECVLIIEGIDQKELEEEARQEWKKMSLEDHMAFYEKQGISRKEAMKLVAKDRGVTKRDVYRQLLGE
jgi:16S rRNA (cytidine1402-2'-O)-methyltransferase